MIAPNRAMQVVLSLVLGAISGSAALAADGMQCARAQPITLANIGTQGTTVLDALVEMRLRPDGRPVILYSGGPSNAQSLRLINCHDSRCGTFDNTLVSSAFNYFDALGLALNHDGRPLILSPHYGRLTYVECGDERCSLSRSVQIEQLFPGDLRTLLVRPDGRPQLVYSMGASSESRHDIVSFTCNDSRCTGGVRQTLVDVSDDRYLTFGAVAVIDAEGRLVVSYLQNGGNFYDTDFQFLRCTDTACSDVTRRTVSAELGYRNAQRAWSFLLPDGRPILLDDRSIPSQSVLSECADGACEDAVSTELFSSPGRRLLGIGADAERRPLFGTLTTETAGFYFCEDADCNSVRILETPADRPFLNAASLQMTPQAQPVLAYFDDAGSTLRLLQCNPARVFADSFD